MAFLASFTADLEKSLQQLPSNEWAVTEARERAIAGVSSVEAFQSIVGVIQLAARQQDAYAFQSCCWLALALIRRSETTEVPNGLLQALREAEPVARRHECENAVREISAWYRVAT